MIGTEQNRILNKALALFNKYGIRSVSMDDLVGELGISKKTLYQIISDKNELVDLVETYRYDIRQQFFEKIYEQNLPAIEEMVAIHQIIEKLISQYSKVFEHDLRKYYTDIYVERNRERIAKMINAVKKNLVKGIKEGVYRQDINIEIVSDYKMSYFIFMAEQDTLEKTYGHMEYFNEIFNLHMYGILSEIGLKAYSYIKNKKTIE